MNKMVFLLILLSIGCVAEISSGKGDLTLTDSKRNDLSPRSNVDCSVEPILALYEEFFILGVKEANLSTEDTNITFKKSINTENAIKEKLILEFGEKILYNSCSISGTNFFVSEAYEGSQGVYIISYKTDKDALEAANFLESVDRNHFKTNKFLTNFIWGLYKNTIFINYYDQALDRFYNKEL